MGEADIAEPAGLMAEPARAVKLLALLDGRERPASVLSRIAGVSMSTVSEHLSTLPAGGLLDVRPNRRHRYLGLPAPRLPLPSSAVVTPRCWAVRPYGRDSDSVLQGTKTCYDLSVARLKQFDPEAAVQQAMQVFWRQGYAMTSPQDLVDELGIGKGSLYNAFNSKHELFERALRRYGQIRVVALKELLERPGPVKPKLREALARLSGTEPTDGRARGCLAVNTAAELAGVDGSATILASRVFDQIETVLHEAIVTGQRTGEIDRRIDPDTTASMLLGVAVGMSVLAKTAPSSPRLTRMAEAALAQI